MQSKNKNGNYGAGFLAGAGAGAGAKKIQVNADQPLTPENTMLDINENPNQPIPPRLDETLSYRTDWIAEGKDIVSDKGHKIASCEAAEDASGIVKAINNHDCLVYALHRLLNSQPYGRPEEWAETKEFAKEFLKQILEN